MKIRNPIFLLVLLGCAGYLQAQSPAIGKTTAKELPFGQPLPRLRQASDLIAKVAIPGIQKPFIVRLDLAAQMQAAKDQCPYLLAQQPTLHLEGERNTNVSVKLDWETTNGWNNESFVLERSLGDTFHFAAVNSTWAKPVAGFSDSYHLPDENDYNKVSYYRVKLLLRNGSSLYSNIAPVKGYVTDQLTLSPNPAAGRIVITLYSDQAGDALIKTFDATGKLALQQYTTLQAGYNTRELNMAHLSGGLYTVQVSMPDKTEKIARLIRQ